MSAFSLAGRTALVTGANTGIDQAIAVALAQAGAEVIASGRRDCDETVALMGQVSDKAGRSLTLDFADPMAARDVFADQPIDILVNNAGIIRRDDAVDFTEADWDAVMDVNAIAPGYIETANTEALRADPDRSRAIPERIPAGRWGRPEDIAQTAVFLAAPASDYVNGAILNVDGGWLAR